MHILPYTIANTNDLMARCGGLVCGEVVGRDLANDTMNLVEKWV